MTIPAAEDFRHPLTIPDLVSDESRWADTSDLQLGFAVVPKQLRSGRLGLHGESIWTNDPRHEPPGRRTRAGFSAENLGSVQPAIERSGCIEVWVNNAGIGVSQSGEELSIEDRDAMRTANVKGVRTLRERVDVPRIIMFAVILTERQ